MRPYVAGALAILSMAVAAVYASSNEEAGRRRRQGVAVPPVHADAGSSPKCDVPPRILGRVMRGYFAGRSGDVVMVEDAPNQLGTIHSTPWGFTQRIPLVLFGPGHIRAGVRSSRSVTIADIAPTYARLLRFHRFPERDGRVLDEALVEGTDSAPRLIVTVVWDGAGTNVLRRWSRAWPNLRDLQRRGTTYTKATAGSSPSVTPAVHATLGTGFFAATHGLPDVKIQLEGVVVDPWEDGSPRLLEKRALADLWDSANRDRAEVAVVAHDFWHVGMIGHGSQVEGDKDIAVLDDLSTPTSFTTNHDFYRLPGYVHDVSGLEAAIAEVDGRDGLADGMWLGTPLNPQDGLIRAMPPWNILQTDKIVQLLRREGFGSDSVADLFFTNYKSTDLAGHAWNMEEPQVRENLEQQDAELGRLVRALDELVGRGRYVLALTADHGMAPYPETRGGWPIDVAEVTRDVNRRFSPDGEEVVLANRGFQLLLDEAVLADAGFERADVAEYLRAYTIGDNAPDDQPPAAEREKNVFSTALTYSELKACSRDG
ncbi:MAG TPA: alkaline phosphatase family protein [Actinomycetota bacterium]|nr:alkaline phosphatase family protein [Actinomycetota bacterium]